MSQQTSQCKAWLTVSAAQKNTKRSDSQGPSQWLQRSCRGWLTTCGILGCLLGCQRPCYTLGGWETMAYVNLAAAGSLHAMQAIHFGSLGDEVNRSPSSSGHGAEAVTCCRYWLPNIAQTLIQ
jgi:hypothetical protein